MAPDLVQLVILSQKNFPQSAPETAPETAPEPAPQTALEPAPQRLRFSYSSGAGKISGSGAALAPEPCKIFFRSC